MLFNTTKVFCLKIFTFWNYIIDFCLSIILFSNLTNFTKDTYIWKGDFLIFIFFFYFPPHDFLCFVAYGCYHYCFYGYLSLFTFLVCPCGRHFSCDINCSIYYIFKHLQNRIIFDQGWLRHILGSKISFKLAILMDNKMEYIDAHSQWW